MLIAADLQANKRRLWRHVNTMRKICPSCSEGQKRHPCNSIDKVRLSGSARDAKYLLSVGYVTYNPACSPVVHENNVSKYRTEQNPNSTGGGGASVNLNNKCFSMYLLKT